eukprot:gene7218-1289_t
MGSFVCPVKRGNLFGRFLALTSSGLHVRPMQGTAMQVDMTGHTFPSLPVAVVRRTAYKIASMKEIHNRGSEALSMALAGESLIFVGSHDGNITSFNTNTGARVHDLHWPKSKGFKSEETSRPVICLAVQDDDLYAGSSDGAVCHFSIAAGELVETVAVHSGWVRALCLSDGAVYSAGNDGRVCTVSDGQARPCPGRPHDDQVLCLAANSGEQGGVASGSADRTIRVWGVDADPAQEDPEVATGSVNNDSTAILRGHENCVVAVQYDSGGLLLIASADNSVRLWDGPVSCLVSAGATVFMGTSAGEVVALSYGSIRHAALALAANTGRKLRIRQRDIRKALRASLKALRKQTSQAVKGFRADLNRAAEDNRRAARQAAGLEGGQGDEQEEDEEMEQLEDEDDWQLGDEAEAQIEEFQAAQNKELLESTVAAEIEALQLTRAAENELSAPLMVPDPYASGYAELFATNDGNLLPCLAVSTPEAVGEKGEKIFIPKFDTVLAMPRNVRVVHL